MISDTNLSLDEKIKRQLQPTHDDKRKIQSRIRQLEKTQHLHLFNTIIKELDIYTITENGTLFDLNDLTLEQFWKLSYHVNLTYDCIKRGRLMTELTREHAGVYNSEFDIESTSMFNEDSNNNNGNNNNQVLDIELDDRLACLDGSNLNYESLRSEALSNASWSKLGKSSQVTTITAGSESKVLDRNVYTDKKISNRKKLAGE